MEDVLDLYHQPYDPKYPTVCIDESSKQLVSHVVEPIPASSGNPQRYDHHYHREGVCNLFMAYEPLKGYRHVRVTERRTRVDFAHFVKELVDIHYPDAECIMLVADNLNIHTQGALYEAFEPQEARRLVCKLQFCYTPKHASWLNMAEIELSALSRQSLKGRIAKEDQLTKRIAAWQERRNQQGKPTDWQFTTKDARIKLSRLYPSQLD